MTIHYAWVMNSNGKMPISSVNSNTIQHYVYDHEYAECYEKQRFKNE